MKAAKASAAIIIQARMGSSRLPGKSLMEIEGKPIIWHVVERAKKSKEAGSVILATTVDKADDALAEFAKKERIACFRGDTNDVLNRYYQAAKTANLQYVVRITGDSPLVDAKLIDWCLCKLKEERLDYVANVKEPWMDGFDVEAFSFATLKHTWEEAGLASEREHVTPYIRNSGKFKVLYFENDRRLQNVHCSIDRENDLEFVREIYHALFANGLDHDFTYKDVIALLEERPEILHINSDSVVNEGYFKSLKEDRKVK